MQLECHEDSLLDFFGTCAGNVAALLGMVECCFERFAPGGQGVVIVNVTAVFEEAQDGVGKQFFGLLQLLRRGVSLLFCDRLFGSRFVRKQ